MKPSKEEKASRRWEWFCNKVNYRRCYSRKFRNHVSAENSRYKLGKQRSGNLIIYYDKVEFDKENNKLIVYPKIIERGDERITVETKFDKTSSHTIKATNVKFGEAAKAWFRPPTP